MVLVAIAVIASTAVGLICERRFEWAMLVSRGSLATMLYLLVPFVSFVNIAHLRVTAGAGFGLVLAYVASALTGLTAWVIGRRLLHLERRSLGALICSVIVVNTGYLGLPMSVALLGAHALSSAVAYDQLVSGPSLFVGGFGVGALFGDAGRAGGAPRLASFLLRNPPLLAVIAGLIAPASLAPSVLVHASHVVVVTLLPLGFFTVGVHLSTERREDAAPLIELPDRRVLTAVCLRLLGPSTLLVLTSALIVKLPSGYLLQAAMPTGINSLIVGHAYGLDQRLIATVVMWSTAAVLIVGVIASAV